VAKIVGVSRATVQKYENGIIASIPSDKVELLSKALTTSPSYLMGWDDDLSTSEFGNLTYDESNHMQKYRVLDEHGKSTVDIITDHEYSRVTAAGDEEPERSRRRVSETLAEIDVTSQAEIQKRGVS